MTEDREREGENVAPYPRRSKRHPPPPHSSAELVEYFEARQRRLEVVATTTTPSGQVIDWIPIGSQVRGGRVAESPPRPESIVTDRERPDERVSFELEQPGVERGPQGTVPILRKQLNRLPVTRLEDYLAKHRYVVREFAYSKEGFPVAFPEAAGGHRYAATTQPITAFGAEGGLSLFDPYTETEEDFSLIQVALTNQDRALQTVEAGWQECHDIYGDWLPHLFLFYTTNGYSDSGDDLGGYNQDVDGWVQHDDSVYPGAVSAATSVRGGAQFVLRIKFKLWQDNWWFCCGDRWLGYYPARLFMGDESVFETLGDHADHVHFYGEIFDSDAVGGKTRTDMTSGYWPDDGWQYSGYLHNLRVQIDRGGKMDLYDGNSFVSDRDMYDLDLHMNSGSNWGSYFWVGGPGAG